MQSPKVSVIIVSYNTCPKLEKCLVHLADSSNDHVLHEIIVVDNGSRDDSVKMMREKYSSVKVIEANQNLGFGKANNLGAEEATGDLFLFLNSDAYAEPNGVAVLATAFEDPTVVAGGGMLKNLDGSLQESVAGPLTLASVFLEQMFLDRLAKLFRKSYWRTTLLPKIPVVEVDQVMGACLMVRREAWEQFDPRFFLYCEDTELCLRLSKKGKIVFVRAAEFIHELGSSSKNNRWLSVARYNLGKELYFGIHQGRVSRTVCWLLNRFGALLRVLFCFCIAIPTCLFGVLPFFWEKGRIFLRVLFARERQIIPADYIPE